MNSVFIIASNTFKEAIRQKLILLTALIAVVLVCSSKYFLKLDLGHEQLRFVFDFGGGALGFFGSIMAIVASCQIFHSELENRTVITLFSKPVNSAQFVFGKLIGAAGLLALFSAVIALSTCAMLLYTSESFGSAAPRLSGGLETNYAGVAAYAIIQWVKLCAVASVSAFICSVSRSLLFSVVTSFMVLAISIMGEATLALGDSSTVFSRAAAIIFPDFNTFNASEVFAFSPVSPGQFFALAGYGILYFTACSLLSSWLFSKREF